MDSSIRVKFRIVIPLLVALIVLCWITGVFHSECSEKELMIKKLQVEVERRDKEIARMKNQITPTSVTKTPVEQTERPFNGEKLVHLDLKGGAPKMNYLVQLLPTLKKWGASGLLVEYEDMFPYDQDLSVLKSAYAYSVAEVKQLLDAVKKYDLLIVPLVQTFGHMEFVLKHQKYSHLRHVPNMTNAINPADSGSIPLVKSIVDQVIKLHKPFMKYLHIGGDEVISVWSLENKENSAHDIYMKHMSPVIDHVLSNDVIPILWDDMMRYWTVEELKKISSKPVEPMVWGYVPDISDYYPKGMWQKYGQAFKRVWIASAFKGADNAYTNFVSIEERVQNHESWLRMKSTFDKNNVNVSGIALTGWSRFDHDSTLCELLPVSMPSLALCLAVLGEGQLSHRTMSTVSKNLGLKGRIILNPHQIPRNPSSSHEGTFLGHEIYGVVLNLRRAYNAIQSVEERLLGWFTDRQVAKKTISNYHLSVCFERLSSASNRLKKLKPTVKKKFLPFFNDDMITEWIWDKVDSKRRRADEIKQRLMKLQSAGDNTIKQGLNEIDLASLNMVIRTGCSWLDKRTDFNNVVATSSLMHDNSVVSG